VSRIRAVTLTGVSLATGAVLFLGGCGALDGLSISTSSDGVSESTQLKAGHAEHSSASAAAEAKAEGAGEAGYNDADVMFLQMMVARQVETAKLTGLADAGQLNKQADALVAAIGSTENDERAEMTGWLRALGEPVTAEGGADQHAEHGGVSTLTKADIKSLKSAGGKKFQTQYLNLLIAQQTNAVEIARYAADNGKNAEVLDLADRISTSRSAQIQQMLGLLSETAA
jgi:uncharacterized protein (DUF305 family)